MTIYYSSISRLSKDANKNLITVFFLLINNTTSNLSRQNHLQDIYRDKRRHLTYLNFVKRYLLIIPHHNGDGSRWICSFEVNTTEVRY